MSGKLLNLLAKLESALGRLETALGRPLDEFVMLEDRNLTSHTYNEATAQSIFSHLQGYALLIRQALAELKARSAAP
jgi:hypothetical protein